ncbi:MAG: crtO [Ilumatobacteraceae bacterium]|nr:crtO [Ilumatobacteraceae bacterium]
MAAAGDTDADVIVIGAGHNGLVTAAYLARFGLRTLLLEARATVGGTAASEPFGGATVNICNCDHLTFRTTPVMRELDLEAHGLRYLDVDPSQLNMTWDEQRPWLSFHDIDRTIDGLNITHPREVEGYRQYLKAALPAVRLVLEGASEPPTMRGLTRRAIEKRMHGVSTLLRWSRRSAADVMRSFFDTEPLRAPALAVGPMVWGISPETPGSGLGALTYAMRHVATVGRPVGGSGAVPEALLASFLAAHGTLRTSSRVSTIVCDSTGVRGVALDDGTEIRADVVVSACDPHRTFVEWLKGAPTQADDLINRWRTTPHSQGYESKIDAILTEVPRLRATQTADFERLGVDPAACTAAISPSLADMDRGQRLMNRGQILDRPGFLVNVPTVMDPTMAPEGRHVLSLEAIYTPYDFTGGWTDTAEPQRWLDQFASLTSSRFSDSIVDWRVMTPATYESEFNLPKGHATSFAGGPLAAMRNKNPELTRYETAVRGLYLTGAATFPGAGVWGASGRNAATVVLRSFP